MILESVVKRIWTSCSYCRAVVVDVGGAVRLFWGLMTIASVDGCGDTVTSLSECADIVGATDETLSR